MEIKYTCGNIELLDTIQPLWEKLNQHHEQVSPHFTADFRINSFEQRKARLLHRYEDGQLRIYLAYHNDDLVGYCISGIHTDSIGEIESIFISEDYRNHHIGYNLMRNALDWLGQQKVSSKVIEVAVGNEDAFKFYGRFGFFPRVTTLKQIGESPEWQQPINPTV
jgi:ribosomal protein S18 acetylase RimI-like enzyme